MAYTSHIGAPERVCLDASGVIPTELFLMPAGSTVAGTTVVSSTTDKTGLFLWRGAKEFLAAIRTDSERDVARGAVDSSSITLVERWLLGSLDRTCVVELGAGIGVGALACAAIARTRPSTTLAASGSRFLITDFWEPVLALAREHVALNNAASKVAVHALDWTWVLQSKLEGGAGSVLLADFAENVRQIVFVEDLSAKDQPLRDDRKVMPCGLVLLGLDVVYPDTRIDVLNGLMQTTSLLLRTACMTQRPASSPYLLMSFVERDVGLTIGRLLRAADEAGLTCIPLRTPFAASSAQDNAREQGDGGMPITSLLDEPLGHALLKLFRDSGGMDEKSDGTAILPMLIHSRLDAVVAEAVELTLTLPIRQLLQKNSQEALLRICASHGSWVLAFVLAKGAIGATSNETLWSVAMPWINRSGPNDDSASPSEASSAICAAIRSASWCGETNRVKLQHVAALQEDSSFLFGGMEL